jgi:thiol-disulfide isomerase/thioredoxin
MGRLPLVAAVLVLAACDKSGDTPAPARSDQVHAAPGAPTTAPTLASANPSASASASATPRPRRKLCDADAASTRAVPKATLSTVEPTGAARGNVEIPYARASFTWINFWAAWCGPCKEEMPRLRAWESKLNAAGARLQIAFVSLDDDVRQVQDFLGAQPAGGIKSTFWLPETTRAGWLAPLKMKSPQLPEHAIVDASGKLKCFIEGAVEDTDYTEVSALLLPH